MALEKTKEVLKRVHDKYRQDLKYAKTDIRPNYDYSVQIGCRYNGISEYDRDFIYYEAFSLLERGVNDAFGPIVFDIDHFVTEKKAFAELKDFKKLIEINFSKLIDLKEKYKDEKYSYYPISVCLSYHEEINSILNEILVSDEVKEFENPGIIADLQNENESLKFNIYWSKRKWKYIIHLAAFIPFIILCGVLFYHKEKEDLVGFSNWAVIISCGLITFVFNLLFNNHNSFKDAWKLLIKKSRQNLIAKEKTDFKTKINFSK